MRSTYPLAATALLAAGLLAVSERAQAQPDRAQTIRPVRDNVGFCWDARTMDQLIGYLTAHEPSPATPAEDAPLVGGISPHDDYLYAGRVYYPLYPRLHAREVVIFGVTHGSVRREIGDPHGILLLDDYAEWTAPYGPVKVSPLRDELAARLDSGICKVNRKAHVLEHSIEATVPFLQYYNRDLRITPIMVTAMPLDRMKRVADALSSALAAYIGRNGLVPGKDIVFLISSDANHYGQDFSNVPFGEDRRAHEQGTALDRTIVQECLTGPVDDEKIEAFTRYTWGKTYTDQGRSVWCGKYSIPMGLMTIRRTLAALSGKPVRAVPLRYSDTYSEGVLPLRDTGMGTTAPSSFKHWCGFASIGLTTE